MIFKIFSTSTCSNSNKLLFIPPKPSWHTLYCCSDKSSIKAAASHLHTASRQFAAFIIHTAYTVDVETVTKSRNPTVTVVTDKRSKSITCLMIKLYGICCVRFTVQQKEWSILKKTKYSKMDSTQVVRHTAVHILYNTTTSALPK